MIKKGLKEAKRKCSKPGLIRTNTPGDILISVFHLSLFIYYDRKGILRYEAIFGRTYVSVGGETTTREFVSQLDLKPGMKILDIGCGTGGSAFYMART